MYCQYPLTVSLNRSLIKDVLADGFFLSFIFEWKGYSLGGRLPRVSLSAVFSLFPLTLILDWLPCQSPRTYVPADGFFLIFIFVGESRLARRAPS